MRMGWTMAALALGVCPQALGQDPHPHWRAPNLFISPMGETFRGNADHTGLELWFAEADANHDGRISLGEFIANAQAIFARIDANGDEAVTSLEATAYWRANAPEVLNRAAEFETPVEADQPSSRQDHSDPDLDGGPRYDDNVEHRLDGANHGEFAPPRGEGAQRYGLLGDAEPIMSCDANLDGRVTKTEFEQCAQRRFVALDANHDGFFTLDEAHLWIMRAHAEH